MPKPTTKVPKKLTREPSIVNRPGVPDPPPLPIRATGLNEQKPDGTIGWACVRGMKGFSINVSSGCYHKCKWRMPDGTIVKCYAEERATSPPVEQYYPKGFQHIYWHPERLDAPRCRKKPSGIFLNSMGDLMGWRVQKEHIIEVLEMVRDCPQHTFILSTKNAPRLLRFADQFPRNLWCVVSAPPTFMLGAELTERAREQYIERAQEVMGVLKSHSVISGWNIEPLSFDIADQIDPDVIDWAIIGAASNGRKTYQPEREWVESLLAKLKGTPVYMKSNLDWPERLKEFPSQPEAIKPVKVGGQPVAKCLCGEMSR